MNHSLQFNEILRELANKRGLSIADVARWIPDASEQAVYGWFQGKRIPRQKYWDSLAAALKVEKNVIANALAGNAVPASPVDEAFSKDELKLVAAYRSLSAKNKKAFLAFIQSVS